MAVLLPEIPIIKKSESNAIKPLRSEMYPQSDVSPVPSDFNTLPWRYILIESSIFGFKTNIM
ncbi:MAG TPA: hypothetical protein PLX49_08645, partial [Prolixibacteraceae bacterium]|nr:hypothetical protein [Prolixibacteraceae bacterium]